MSHQFRGGGGEARGLVLVACGLRVHAMRPEMHLLARLHQLHCPPHQALPYHRFDGEVSEGLHGQFSHEEAEWLPHVTRVVPPPTYRGGGGGGERR